MVMVIAACGGSSPVATRSSFGATSTAQPSHVPTSASPSRTVAPPVGGPVPPGFEPASYTFVSADDGWVLGTAPCALPPCTSLLRTRDEGRTWVGIPAPRTPLAIAVGFNGPLTSGVSTVRFADELHGWVFGPELWETQDGGGHWTQGPVPGPSPSDSVVAALETNGNAVDVVILSGISGQSAAGTARLYTASVGTELWSAVSGVRVTSAEVETLALHGQAGWLVLLPTSGTGPGTAYFFTQGGHAWEAGTLPCVQGSESGRLAVSSAADVLLVCADGAAAGSQAKTAYVSHDGGRTYARVGTPPFAGDFMAVAAASPSTAVIAAASGASYLDATFDGGRSWSEVLVDSQSGGEPWADLGFTTATHGEVIEGRPGSGPSQPASRMLITRDGGHTWSAISFR